MGFTFPLSACNQKWIRCGITKQVTTFVGGLFRWLPGTAKVTSSENQSKVFPLDSGFGGGGNYPKVIVETQLDFLQLGTFYDS